MSKINCWTTILLSLAALVLIGVNLAEKEETKLKIINTNTPTYRSDHSDMAMYNLEGALNYFLTAQHIEYFSNEKVSWFSKPMMTTFDTNKMPTWLVKSDRAKLTKDHILHLYGHVEIKALTSAIQIRKITMNNAKINLITQDISSNDLVALYATTFNSIGLKIHGNLRSKNAELIEKVKTSYGIQNKQNQS